MCKHGCRFHRIQAAVKAARAGDTVHVRRGTYREAVKIAGPRKRYLKLIGDPKHPGRVVLDGRRKDANGVLVNGADQVTVNGFTAKRYRANGFFFVNVNGYTMTHLVAHDVGVYGLYAFNSVGGVISHSEAYYMNDAAFYIGQTPVQTKPERSMVTDVDGWGAPVGFSGTNMRYVTITRSRFYDNGVGIAPNALDSEKYPPAEDNVITGNDIFWNNFDFHRGAPFTLQKNGTPALVPIGTGILLLGGRRNLVEGNRIFGNFLAGVGMVEGVLLQKNPQARDLVGNQVRDNAFGRGGTDTNGVDVSYDGNGTGNCASGSGAATVFPSAAILPACPFAGANQFSQAALNTMLGWSGENATKAWKQHAHPAFRGLKPLVLYRPPRRHGLAARAHPRRVVKVRDDYFAPDRLTVRRGTTVVWRWPSEPEDVHDVTLVRAPKGVKRFHSDPEAGPYSFRRTLRKTGTYKLVCTFHEGMKMTIEVRR